MQINPESFYPPDAPELDMLGEKQTKARHRSEGTGAPYYKIGGRVYYRGSDVLAYLESNRIETGSPEAA